MAYQSGKNTLPNDNLYYRNSSYVIAEGQNDAKINEYS